MKKVLFILLLLIIVLTGAYFAGPKPGKPVFSSELPAVTSDLKLLESQILDREKNSNLKPDNEARFVWANDSSREKTEFALLYLHGFSACWYEGYPVNMDFARHFGCNAYFPRLASHGLNTTEALADMTPDRLWESAKEALMVACQLGEKVVILSSSTGGTLALKLAAEFPERIYGLVLFSPNVEINNSVAWLLAKPWGLQLARKSAGSNYRLTNPDSSSMDCQYWYCKYRLEGIVYLQQLVETTMKEEVFRKVNTPVFLGYYYKDEEHQDKTVRVDAALKMFDQLGTPADKKMKQAFPEAGDHCIACELFSKSVEDVRHSAFAFAEKVLGMKPVAREPGKME
jgi:pimeloyl-ACP methyl ester carboxylesterase